MKVIVLVPFLVAALFQNSQQTPHICPPPPNDENIQDCCDVPTLTTEPTYAHCLGQYGYEGHIPNNCVAGCFMNETKIIASDGTVDETVLKNISQHINNGIADWDPIIEKSVTSCITSHNITTDLDPCDVTYVKVAKCIYHSNFGSCPEKLYKQSPQCDELKKHTVNCLTPQHEK